MAGAAASINVVSGPFSVPINTAFGVPFVAKVTDANGVPVSGVTVTFMPQGQGASCSFAGGVNTAVTDVNGLATSAAVTANGIVGFYQVQAWVGTYPPASGAVGPATFSLANSTGYALANKAAIAALWATAKAQLATVQTDLNTLANDLTSLEASCDQLTALGANDIALWLRQAAKQTRVGWRPRIGAGGDTAPQMLSVWAPDTAARDLAQVDQRPVTIMPTAQSCGLS